MARPDTRARARRHHDAVSILIAPGVASMRAVEAGTTALHVGFTGVKVPVLQEKAIEPVYPGVVFWYTDDVLP